MNNDRTISPDRTAVDISLLLLRIVVGVIFMAHGAQKMFGAFGGPGLKAVVQMFGGGPMGYLVSIGEFFGGVGVAFRFPLALLGRCADRHHARRNCDGPRQEWFLPRRGARQYDETSRIRILLSPSSAFCCRF